MHSAPYRFKARDRLAPDTPCSVCGQPVGKKGWPTCGADECRRERKRVVERARYRREEVHEKRKEQMRKFSLQWVQGESGEARRSRLSRARGLKTERSRDELSRHMREVAAANREFDARRRADPRAGGTL